MVTAEIIAKALAVMNNHDWYWCFSDNTHPAMDNARGSMQLFVKLVATIKESAIRNAMRELWMATYENVHKNMWCKDEEANKQYEIEKAKLMAVILPKGSSMKIAA